MHLNKYKLNLFKNTLLNNIDNNKILLGEFKEKSTIPQKSNYCNNANSAILASTWKKFKFELVFMRGVLLPVISIIGVAASQTLAASTPIENVRRDKFFLVIMSK